MAVICPGLNVLNILLAYNVLRLCSAVVKYSKLRHGRATLCLLQAFWNKSTVLNRWLSGKYGISSTIVLEIA